MVLIIYELPTSLGQDARHLGAGGAQLEESMTPLFISERHASSADALGGLGAV